MLRRFVFCNLSMQQIQPVFYFYAQRMCSSNSEDKLIYLSNNTNTILNLLNSRSSNYLSKFNIPVEALKLHKEKHGPYKSINDVLQVEGMSEDILKEFLHLLDYNQQSKKKQKVKKSVISPTIEKLLNKDISNVLGIYVGTNVVTWTLLESNNNVLEWNYKSFSDIPEKSNILNLFNMAWKINNILPPSDVYVLDDQYYDHNAIKSIMHLKSHLQKQQLKAMILTFLKTRNLNPEDGEPTINLYLTLHNKVANLFGLQVGSEITSSAIIVNKLLHRKDIANNKEKHPIGVYVTEDIMNVYGNQVDYIQDQMNWSLLIAITFLQLGFYRNYNLDFI